MSVSGPRVDQDRLRASDVLMTARFAIEEIRQNYHQPLFALLDQARDIHRKNFPSGEIQASSLLSIKTGGCPENCSYCPQSAHYKTETEKKPLLSKAAVIDAAVEAKEQGATRFCMGAAWRNIRNGDEFDRVLELVEAVNSTGLEVCCTLGMLTQEQAERLKQAGLYAYNHNLDTSRSFYSKIVQTRTYDDRLQTIRNVRSAGLTVCTGGILGLGETDVERIEFIHQLVSLQPQPESITINTLVPFRGTPLGADEVRPEPVTPIEIVRVVATLRVFAPLSMIRLSAGRLNLSDEAQFLCFYAGANSIFLGEKLLTSPNPTTSSDAALMRKIGVQFQPLAQVLTP